MTSCLDFFLVMSYKGIRSRMMTRSKDKGYDIEDLTPTGDSLYESDLSFIEAVQYSLIKLKYSAVL